MGKNKRNIIIAAVLAMLSTSANPAIADSLSNLLQMDVKKSSAADTIDVTFYTTGEASNSVVTRKSNNRYVVLLPNTSSTASVAPSIGGVKDLITNVDVKHVNDGIGGYTKVTFGTTKPINIKTHMKKTNPLTQAQKDSQAIIAKNKSTTEQTTQPKTQVAQKETAKPTTTNTTQTKPATQAQKTSTPKLTPVSVPKATTTVAQKPKQEAAKPKAETKATPAKTTQPKVEPKVETKPQPKIATTPVQSNSYVPKMKYDENGKRLIDLEPRVSHNIIVEKPAVAPTESSKMASYDLNKENLPETAVENTTVEETAVDTPIIPESENSSNHNLAWWILVAGGSIVALCILYLVFDAMIHANKKDQSRLDSFFKLSSQNQAKRRKREYYEIADNKELSWQEKYKLFVEKEESNKPKRPESAMSFVTDMAGLKKAVVMPDVQEEEIYGTSTSTESEKSHNDIMREKLQAKISQMEHALAQTPSLIEPEEISNEVKSEDDAIISKVSEIKLKSFSKPATLKESQRSLLEDDKKISRNKAYKEGRFVKLNNSPLSVNRRRSGASKLEVTDLIGTGSKYLTNNGEMKMSKENENYLVSSLNEYISLLDSEGTSTSTVSRTSVADTLAQVKSSAAQAMSRSGVSNPISRASNPMSKTSPSTYMNGLIVKSGYNIDSQKGFYVVNIDGVSALVGRIKDSIFVLKKFDYVVDKPIQVRQDHDSVYIVRVGGFKCLVDVSKDKMGTLIEI